jgi:hypothetical protein
MWWNPGSKVLNMATEKSTGNMVKHKAESHLDSLKLVRSYSVWVSDTKVRGQPGSSVVQLDPEVMITKNTLSETHNRHYIYISQNLIVNGKTTLHNIPWHNCPADYLFTFSRFVSLHDDLSILIRCSFFYIFLRQNNSAHFSYMHLDSSYSTSEPLYHMSATLIPVYEYRKVMLTSSLHQVQQLRGNADGGATW